MLGDIRMTGTSDSKSDSHIGFSSLVHFTEQLLQSMLGVTSDRNLSVRYMKITHHLPTMLLNESK